MGRSLFFWLMVGIASFGQLASTSWAELGDGNIPAPMDEQGADGGKLNHEVRFLIERLVLEYRPIDHPQQVPIEQLMQIKIKLAKTERGYTLGGPADSIVEFRLDEIPELPTHWFSVNALKVIQDRIVVHLNENGLAGVLVVPHREDIDRRTLQDLRPKGADGVLRLIVWTGIVARAHTVATSEIILLENQVDNRRYERIKERSPVRPWDDSGDERRDIFRKDLLDEYLYRLNRHPGRRVDVAVSPGGRPGELALDYLVSESKPWLAYVQLLNTGTRETRRLRQRFGFVHNQFSNNDDILSINYITAEFDDIHAGLGSYEAPWFDSEKVRYRVHGLWSQFDSSEIGSSDTRFSGREWSLGGDIIANVFQHKELFIDAVAGFRCQEIVVQSEIAGQKGVGGKENFFLPHFSFTLERITEKASTLGAIDVEWNYSGLGGTGQSEVVKLGRMDVDDEWVVLHWNLQQSFYLEPLLDRNGWEDPATPATSTLAHEMAFSFKGQITDDRLIPQARRSAGGFFTVRGYPESMISGDSVFMGSGEYRFHLPRTFEPRRDHGKTKLFGKPFRWAPERVYARPDWDLIFRMFVDIANVRNTPSSDADISEQNKMLLGVGLGIELQVTRTFNVRCDWGVPLEAVRTTDERVDVGDSRLHVVGTIMY